MKKLLLEFGCDGGQAFVYQLNDNTINDTGSGGGILDEEEHPHNKWQKSFNSWADWWQNFVYPHQRFRIYLSPLFI